MGEQADLFRSEIVFHRCVVFGSNDDAGLEAFDIVIAKSGNRPEKTGAEQGCASSMPVSEAFIVIEELGRGKIPTC